MTLVVGEDPHVVIEPKAGSVGVVAVVFYGLACVVAVFVAAFFWLDGDITLAATFGVGSLAIPVTAGFFTAELRHQRAGAVAFVVTAGVIAGAAAASAWVERPEYLEQQDRGGVPFEDAQPFSAS